MFFIFKWSSKHPYGILTENLGEVNDPKNFYNYQIYCRKLNNSISILSALSLSIYKKYDNDQHMLYLII